MPIQPPTRQQLEWLADTFHLTLTEEELDVFEEAAGPALAGFTRLDELPDEHLPVKYPRVDMGHRPVGAENPSNGWSWRCSIPGAPSGPLAGKTVGVKDNVCVAGIPMLNGSPIMEGYVPREDATVVTRLLDAGAHIVGKTAVPAFCFDGGGLTGYPDPQPTNPHNPAYLCGSSSNGSAAVLVENQCDLALGGDQGGSIRLPASWSGCCGHKPTFGLVPYTGIFPIELTIDHIGPMARTVADCALMLEAIAGEDGLDPRQIGVSVQSYVEALEVGADGLRVGVLSEGFGIPDASEADVDAAVRDGAEALARAGASVEEVSIPMHRDGLAIWNAIATEGATDLMVRGDAFGTNHKGHYTTDLVDFYGRARRARAADYSVTVKLTILLGAYLSEDYNHHYYAKAQNLGRRLKARYAEALERFDVLVLPTTAMKARPIPVDATIPDVLAAALGNLHNTSPFDVTGNPALSVPCGMSDGLPVGMMLIGRHFDDATVLRAGHAYQSATAAPPTPARATSAAL
jgi:amidase